ncbi:helix-turn-helix domain-containing protein [Lysobacter pythonis]|uniref:Helix-turn-helix domain-containing protein n=1 Tax=Solilutibacter pythonis TaxID=2483112 RepID=A0A3M2I3D4_9GAMM|nr:helix-turn-helix domain-containing protein [Lysobacter pythonis]RMH94845.1 helix-turn-helix domain-containing protein [Lysobacter pythonis]
MNSSSPHHESQAASAERLRQAREHAGLSLETLSAELHMPVRTLAALESGDWSKLGAPVFVRGQLRSYARRLGLDAESLLADADVAPVRPVQLVSREHVSGWERFFNQLGTKIVYVVMTLGLVIPTWMALTRSPVSDQDMAAAKGMALDGTRSEMSSNQLPVTASMAPLPKKPVAPAAALGFVFDGESWVQFYAPDGSTLEKGLMKPGDRRQFAPGQLGRVVIGNASEVRVLRAGEALDMTPWLKSNVARFAVSSDGSPATPAP